MKRMIAILISAVLILGSAVSAFASSAEDPLPEEASTDYILKDVVYNVGSWQEELNAITELGTQLGAEEVYKDQDHIVELLLETELENERSSGSDPITWQKILNGFPYVPVQILDIPYVLNGMPWIAVYVTVMKMYPEGMFLAFDQSGRAISYEDSVHVTVETGQHMAYMEETAYGGVVELATVGSFLPPTDSDLNPPKYDVKWDMICSRFPNYKVEVLDFDQDPMYRFVGAPWIALNYVMMTLEDVILLPFDSAGNYINYDEQKTVVVEKGQHIAFLDINSGQLRGLFTVGPVPPPTSGITIADLVTLARALNGQITLTEAQKEKYGVTGTAPTISDLVRLAKQLNN